MKRLAEPLAITLYRRFLNGETVQELAAALAIPEERVDQRIRAAALYSERTKLEANLFALKSSLDHS